MIKKGSLLILYSTSDGKKFFVKNEETSFSTHLGIVNITDNLEYGVSIKTHTGNSFIVLRPTLDEIIMKIKRHTQILYPKDIGYILLKLGLRDGDTVVEAGTGSGALTISLAYAVSPSGKVFSYEKRKDFLEKAYKNILLSGFQDNVVLKNSDVYENGFDENSVDAVFLDLKEPETLIEKSYNVLKTGGMLGILVPTTNQVSSVLKRIQDFNFNDIEVSEIMIRKYKLVPERLRPEDTMVGHTGYLLFARKMI
ncbi:MAG TPA: tRNA (adenine-N1)-methyltransferase [Spirochaetota bacterium]|nr:tRNA (adenine-N1)-methyltransferase [Spirochaetota bacterium]HOM38726.1 tRNA (adenine-N1)-methyltransferase [Spirochaetota bacterium]HPQ49523.1 tRNA (adenine-N1)-methyltransferase [Spirochaetota bacterium]